MSVISPARAPFVIAESYPELSLVNGQSLDMVETIMDDASTLETFRENLMAQGAPGTDSGWARKVVQTDDGKPAYHWNLTLETLEALSPFLNEVLTQVMTDDGLAGVCWTVQPGVVPGPEENPLASQDWCLKNGSPVYGLILKEVGFSQDGNRFFLTLVNDMPRHLGAYVRFFKDSVPVSPEGWSSHLPKGVPEGFETDELKFLEIISPAVAVGGLFLPTATAILEFSLPDNADSAQLVFGGPGLSPADMPATACGLFLTYILDVALPVILRGAGAGTEKSDWFATLISDQEMVDDILAQGTFLLGQAQASLTDLLAQLAERVPSLFSGSALSFLRRRISEELGSEAVEDAVPYLGWPAQILARVLDIMPGESGVETANTQILPTRLTAVPSAIRLPCFPGMAGMLDLELLPDPAYGLWPPNTDFGQVTVGYGNGFSRKWEGKPTGKLSFASLSALAPIYIQADLCDGNGQIRATGQRTIPDPASLLKWGTIPADLVFQNQTEIITSDTVYRLENRLRYDAKSQVYVWDADVKSDAAASGRVLGLVGITSRSSEMSIGYTFRASGLGLPDCQNRQSLDTGYIFRNIGTADPEIRLKTIDCCFTLMPHLVYAKDGTGETTCYFDPRNGANRLCPVDLSQVGDFDLTCEKSLGRFRETILDAMTVSPKGHAAAVAAASGTLEILKLADTVRETPSLSMVFRGEGTREGPLQWPVGIDVTPENHFLVLERHPIRIRCFDVYANPVSRFNGSACFMPEDEGASGLDISVSPSGLIYILLSRNQGQTAADYSLSIFSQDGNPICAIPGVEAARMTVTGDGRVYTLDPFSIAGPGDRPEPRISQWLPGCPE